MLDADLYAGETEPAAFAAVLPDSTWPLVGPCAAGTLLTWVFVRGSHDTPVEPEHQTQRRFHLPWVAPSTAGRNRAGESSTGG